MNKNYDNLINDIVECLQFEQSKYEYDDYSFPVSRAKIASYSAFSDAINIVRKVGEKYGSSSYTH